YPSAQWVRHAERLVELDGQLPALLRGEAQPAAADLLVLADLCARCKRLYAAGARFYREAFAAEPVSADDLQAGHRYRAARAAALAATGQGEDAVPLDDKERSRWRQQALAWLRAELALWAKQLDKDTPEARGAVQKALQSWKGDAAFAGLRDPAAVAQLP